MDVQLVLNRVFGPRLSNIIFMYFIQNRLSVYKTEFRIKYATKVKKVPRQHLVYLGDQAAYGDLQEGVYKGLKWFARRPGHGMLHWNGYVQKPRALTDTEFDELGALTHGGITAHGDITARGGINGDYRDMVGFDCAHAGDFQPGYFWLFNPHGEYRHFLYVESVIERMIDYLVTLPK